MMHFQLKRAKEMAQTCWRHRNEGEEGTRVISIWKQTVKVHVAHFLIQPACTSLSLPVKFISDTVQRQLKVLWQPMASDLQETFSAFHKAIKYLHSLGRNQRIPLESWNPGMSRFFTYENKNIGITVNYWKATFLDCLPCILYEVFRNVLACSENPGEAQQQC